MTEEWLDSGKAYINLYTDVRDFYVSLKYLLHVCIFVLSILTNIFIHERLFFVSAILSGFTTLLLIGERKLELDLRIIKYFKLIVHYEKVVHMLTYVDVLLEIDKNIENISFNILSNFEITQHFLYENDIPPWIKKIYNNNLLEVLPTTYDKLEEELKKNQFKKNTSVSK